MLSEKLLNKISKLKPLHEKNAVKDIFSWNELENILNFRPLVSDNRLKINSSNNYTWENEGWLTDKNTWPINILFQELNNYSAYLSDMSKANFKINSICDQLEKLFKIPTDAHIYFAINDNNLETSGFPIHWDWSHNLIVQVEGVSNHQVWNIQAKGSEPRTYNDTFKEKPVLDVTMEPGDVTFIPRMMYHKVTSLTKRISISFPSNFCNNLKIQDRNWMKIN